MNDTASRLSAIYRTLQEYFGDQNWWPADTPFEVMVGAVLTQNTNWQNVSKTIDSLKEKGLLSIEALLGLSDQELAILLKSSGYYNLKAKRLRNLLDMVRDKYGGDLDGLFAEDLYTARESLLGVKGVGPETADAILLYGGNFPVFVVDAYTHRIFSRHQLVPDECDYQTMQEIFMDNLEHDQDMFNEYHALIVKTAKEFCKKNKPLCDKCPIYGK